MCCGDKAAVRVEERHPGSCDEEVDPGVVLEVFRYHDQFRVPVCVIKVQDCGIAEVKPEWVVADNPAGEVTVRRGVFGGWVA